jgi:hypothetical protein
MRPLAQRTSGLRHTPAHATERCTNASVVSATSRKPSSIAGAFPRAGNETISATPSFRLRYAAFATVWILAA